MPFVPLRKVAAHIQGWMAGRSLSCCSAATGCRNPGTWTTNCESETWTHTWLGLFRSFCWISLQVPGSICVLGHSFDRSFAFLGIRSCRAAGRKTPKTGRHLELWRTFSKIWSEITRYTAARRMCVYVSLFIYVCMCVCIYRCDSICTCVYICVCVCRLGRGEGGGVNHRNLWLIMFIGFYPRKHRSSRAVSCCCCLFVVSIPANEYGRGGGVLTTALYWLTAQFSPPLASDQHEEIWQEALREPGRSSSTRNPWVMQSHLDNQTENTVVVESLA